MYLENNPELIMKKILFLFVSLWLIACVPATRKETTWKIAENPILTQWASRVDPLKPWPEYPRPDLVRKNWINLNGLWDYAITPKGTKPETWTGQILVPYPVESALSGVKKRVSDAENLWYKTSFKVPSSWTKEKLLLNFEASDWETTVWIDGKEAGIHKGGYDPFTFEISGLLNKEKAHELLVCIWDPTSSGPQPRGKQVNNPGGIWYTPTTGIWQTVWLEPVKEAYISSFRAVPDIDSKNMSFVVSSPVAATNADITISASGKEVAKGSGNTGEKIVLNIENPVLWSIDNPFLYDISISLKENGKVTDKITSVAGMRKISIGKSKDGFTRMLLNNEFVFQNGPLDQGFWPDGLYTPPTDAAMVYDLRITKKMGFNMLRKHVKVENRRFYNWCDKMGILVWQDMPSGDSYINGTMPDITKTEEAGKQYEYELQQLIETKYNHPSIIMWVPYNEGWGQWDTERITGLVKSFDPTRIVNSASGWTDRGTGDLKDVHTYPNPRAADPEENRASVIGEFGGLGYPVKDHTWEATNWGYRTFQDTMTLVGTYESYLDQIFRFVNEKGLSAVIYTQTTDCETETNGLLTYDRKVDKMGWKNVSRANKGMTPPVLERTILAFHDEFPVVISSHDKTAKIHYTTDGSEPDGNSAIYTEPFTIKEACVLKAYAEYGTEKSRTISYSILKKDMFPATVNGKFRKGLNAVICQGEFRNIPEFKTLKPVKTLTAETVTARVTDMTENFALSFDGYVQIPEDGIYGFFINSDDGSRLVIDDKLIIANDGVHTRSTEQGDFFALAKGYHKLNVGYFQTNSRRPALRLSIETPGKPRMEIPQEWFFR
jgi:hypothetical protein